MISEEIGGLRNSSRLQIRSLGMPDFEGLRDIAGR